MSTGEVAVMVELCALIDPDTVNTDLAKAVIYRCKDIMRQVVESNGKGVQFAIVG